MCNAEPDVSHLSFHPFFPPLSNVKTDIFHLYHCLLNTQTNADSRVHIKSLLMACTSISPVSDKLHPADHLSDGEEAEDLSEDDSSRGDLGAADVADGVHGRVREERRWVSAVLDDLLEGGLESCERSVTSPVSFTAFISF
jgi:hypothetical protein